MKKYDEYRVFVDYLLNKIESAYRKSCWVAATLTIKQGRTRDDGTVQKVTDEEIKKVIKQLMKSLNKAVFGNAYRRHHKRLAVIPSIEISSNNRRHIHLLLQIPEHWHHAKESFLGLVAAEWQKLSWARHINDIRALPTSAAVTAWAKYILKELRIHRDAALDVENMHI